MSESGSDDRTVDKRREDIHDESLKVSLKELMSL
jgi:hypothetical protein